jgi:adenylylsulfate kinase
VKGLYAKARAGEISGMTGVDDPYEEPVDPALRLETAGRPVSDAVTDLLDLLRQRELV